MRIVIKNQMSVEPPEKVLSELEAKYPPHTWNIHYANADGESFHHQTIFEAEVRLIAAKALECGMISLTVLRTLNPVPHTVAPTAPKS